MTFPNANDIIERKYKSNLDFDEETTMNYLNPVQMSLMWWLKEEKRIRPHLIYIRINS